MPKVVLTSSQLWSNVLWYTIGSVTWLLEKFSRLEGLGLTDDTIVNLNLQQYRPYIYSSSEDFKFRGDTQARSQDWYRGGGAETKKVEIFYPKSRLCYPTSLPPRKKKTLIFGALNDEQWTILPSKTLFLVHFVAKRGPFGHSGEGVVRRTHRTPWLRGPGDTPRKLIGLTNFVLTCCGF